jgi:hypothetical protein
MRTTPAETNMYGNNVVLVTATIAKQSVAKSRAVTR